MLPLVMIMLLHRYPYQNRNTMYKIVLITILYAAIRARIKEQNQEWKEMCKTDNESGEVGNSVGWTTETGLDRTDVKQVKGVIYLTGMVTHGGNTEAELRGRKKAKLDRATPLSVQRTVNT